MRNAASRCTIHYPVTHPTPGKTKSRQEFVAGFHSPRRQNYFMEILFRTEALAIATKISFNR